MKSSLLIFLLLFCQIFSQESLAPLNNCLGNCAVCKPDEPATCSGQQFVQCVKGYEGPGCQIKDTYADEFVFFETGTPQANKKDWQLTGTAKCTYKNSLKQLKTINVLGMYSQFDYNVVSHTIQPFYKNFIFSFTLIRTSWTPYSDLLRLAVMDQDQEIIHEYFIQYQQRDEISAKKNLLSCQNQLMIVEKFQIQAKINPSLVKKISIRFQGMMFSEARWSLTDVKLAFGCSKFLNYDETYQKCKGCMEGFKQLTNVEGCVPCDVSCSSCNQNGCTVCNQGFTLKNDKCISNYKQSTFLIPSANMNCPSIGTLALSAPTSIGQQLQIPISLPISPNNKLIKFRISFHLYVQLNDNITDNEQDYILVYINNIQQSELTQSQLYDKSIQKTRSKCNMLNKSVNFILVNVHSNYIEATDLNNQNKQALLKIQRSQKFTFALSSVFIEYQQKQDPKKQEPKKQQPKKVDPTSQLPKKEEPSAIKQEPVTQLEQPKPNNQSKKENQTIAKINQKLPNTKEQANNSTGPRPAQAQIEPIKQKQSSKALQIPVKPNKTDDQKAKQVKKSTQTQLPKNQSKLTPPQDVQKIKQIPQKQKASNSNTNTIQPIQQQKPNKQVKKTEPSVPKNQPSQINQKAPPSPIQQKPKQSAPHQNNTKENVQQPNKSDSKIQNEPKKASEQPVHQDPPASDPPASVQPASPSHNIQQQKPKIPQQSTPGMHDPITDNSSPALAPDASTQNAEPLRPANQDHKLAPPSSPLPQSSLPVVPAVPSTPSSSSASPAILPITPVLNTSSVSLAISQSIQKLQAHKNNIQFTLIPSSNLVINLRSPIELQHFPYFTLYLHNSNRTIVPEIVNISKTQQLLKLINNQQSIIDQSVQIFMADQLQHEQLQRNIRHQQKLTSNHVRLLQFNSSHSLGVVHIVRYDQLPQSHWQTMAQLSSFFTVISWVTILSTIVLSFFGISIITQQLSLLLQIIFLHVYIYTEYLPASFKGVVGGLWRMQNLNYITKNISQKIQKFLLSDIVQQSPSTLRQYHLDINFTRAIYACIIILAAYLVWFMIVWLIAKFKIKDLPADQEQFTKLDKLKIKVMQFSERILNFWTQVWQYMYITFVWATLLQFYNIDYPQNSTRSSIPNIIFCIICLILCLTLPILTFIRTHRQYFILDYFKYSHKYSHIFYLQLPQSELPSNQHRIHILIRCFRYVLLCMCFSYLCRFPVQALIVVLISHVLYLIYKIFARIQRKLQIKIVNIVQTVLLVLLAILEMIAYGVSSWMITPNYIALGYAMSAVSLLAIINGFVHVAFNIYYMINNKLNEHPSVSVKNQEEGSP